MTHGRYESGIRKGIESHTSITVPASLRLLAGIRKGIESGGVECCG